MMTMLNSQGTLDGAYFKGRAQELDRKLIGIFERAEPITQFNDIKFGQIVNKITVISDTKIRFDLIGGIGLTERIER